MPIDIQNMSDLEIAELATRCLTALDLAERVQAILKSLHSNTDREELQAWLEEAIQENEEGEDEGEE